MNSDDMENPNVWQALVLLSPTFVVDPWSCESTFLLCPGSMRQEFLDHLRLLAIPSEVIHYFMPRTVLHEVQDRCCVATPARVLATPAPRKLLFFFQNRSAQKRASRKVCSTASFPHLPSA